MQASTSTTQRQLNLHVIATLTPPSLWRHFAEIASIPRPSSQEAAVLRYIETVAESLGLICRRDSVGNLVAVKKGSEPGRSPLAFQCHVDMVCEQNNSGTHDFTKDPIKLRQRPEHPGWIFATDTTLGADNGIGVSAMLAVMEAFPQPKRDLEFLFTIDEETGLTGAQGLASDLLRADTLLNLDTEEEGSLYVGCAGGLDFDAEWNVLRSPLPHTAGKTLGLQIKGLKGGHSGIDIDKQRGNAIKILAHVLHHLLGKIPEHKIRIFDLQAGKARNAIPREAAATLWVAADFHQQCHAELREQCNIWRSLLAATDPQLEMLLDPVDPPDMPPFESEWFKRWLHVPMSLPSQPYRMELDIPGLVRTSSNLGVAQTDASRIILKSKLRSSFDPELAILRQELEALISLNNGRVNLGGGYCGWQPDLRSQLLALCQTVHLQIFGHKAQVKAIHAGLECGLIGSKYPQMQMVSFGPNIANAHSPDEAVEIRSVETFWRYLEALVQHLDA